MEQITGLFRLSMCTVPVKSKLYFLLYLVLNIKDRDPQKYCLFDAQWSYRIVRLIYATLSEAKTSRSLAWNYGDLSLSLA